MKFPKVYIHKRGFGDMFDDMLTRTFTEADKKRK